jgi:hypothetical protein
MNPAELIAYLDGVVRNRLRMSVMIWGPPGVGKSSVVEQIATKHYLGFVDVRLSQLSPSDLRGLPVADHHDAVSRHYAPEFLPRKGGGILFLDELNMATPALQGVAQQLILDRKIGNYLVPEGWYIWAAGNRKEDRAAVYELTGPVTNRFIHLEIRPDINAFLSWAVDRGIHPHLSEFLRERPHFLHKFDPHSPAWPSPRTWMMADQLHKCGLSIAAAVGEEAAVEFASFGIGGQALPKLDLIVMGTGDAERFPRDPSTCTATLVGLLSRSSSAANCYNILRWMARRSTPEWVNEYVEELMRRVRLGPQEESFRRLVAQDKYLQEWFEANLDRFSDDGIIQELIARVRV